MLLYDALGGAVVSRRCRLKWHIISKRRAESWLSHSSSTVAQSMRRKRPLRHTSPYQSAHEARHGMPRSSDNNVACACTRPSSDRYNIVKTREDQCVVTSRSICTETRASRKRVLLPGFAKTQRRRPGSDQVSSLPCVGRFVGRGALFLLAR